jgi:hypothetical protein
LSQRKYISATILIIVCTTSILSALILREVRNLQNYMGYIAENGKSALFHEEFINQNIAFRLSRAFSSKAPLDSDTQKNLRNFATMSKQWGVFLD